MRISEILFEEDESILETPLPSDWEQEPFNKGTTFKKMLAYAKERAAEIGKGSSRVAFTIPYNGRDTVLKIAMNRKGLAQNQAESELLSDGYIRSMDIVIPMIDYDEQGGRVSWIHTEKAQQISQKQLESYFGTVPMTQVVRYVKDLIDGINIIVPDMLQDSEYFHDLRDLVENFDLPLGDFVPAHNWGLYKGRPVIIDLGFTVETAKLYQRR